MKKEERTKLIENIKRTVFKAASSIVYSGVGPEEALAKLGKQFPFIRPNVMVMGLKKYWIQIVRSNMQTQ